VLCFLIPLIVVTIGGLAWLWPRDSVPSLGGSEYINGTITAVTTCEGDIPDCQVLLVDVIDGPSPGDKTEINMTTGSGTPEFTPGTAVKLSVDQSSGKTTYGYADVKRDQPLLILAVLFAVAVVVLSRWKGVAALAGLAVSIFILVAFVMPALLLGSPPLAVAAFGAAAIAIASMGLAHGFNIRTGVALVGTVLALLLTAGLGWVFTAAASFTGVGGEEAWYLQNSLNLAIDFRGLFLAGLVIGALGVLDDVTVTQVAAVWEVRRANPLTPLHELYSAGMRVGRDHVAATVNTLVLAYIGASLPLFLILIMSSGPASQSLTNELIASEIVRSLVGGLGIVAAVPITTFMAAWVLTRSHDEIESSGDGHQTQAPVSV